MKVILIIYYTRLVVLAEYLPTVVVRESCGSEMAFGNVAEKLAENILSDISCGFQYTWSHSGTGLAWNLTRNVVGSPKVKSESKLAS